MIVTCVYCADQSSKVVMLEDLAAHFKIKTQVSFYVTLINCCEDLNIKFLQQLCHIFTTSQN